MKPLHFDEEVYQEIANSINPEGNVLLNQQDLNPKIKYKVIVLNIWSENTNIEEQLLKLSEHLDESGTLCAIMPTSFLFSKRDKHKRDILIKLFHIEGVITLKQNIYKSAGIPRSLLLLDKKKGKTWFTTASDSNSLLSFLKNRKEEINNKKGVYNCDEVDANNLMPEHYNGEVEKVNQVLNKYQTRKLYEVAELFVGRSIPQHELVTEKGFQYIRPRNVSNGKINPSGVYIINNYLEKYSKYTLLPGDILISKQFGQRKLVQVSEEDCPAIASNGFIVIRPTEIPEQYLFSYFTSTVGNSIFNKQLDSIETGTTIRNINLSDIKELRVPIFDSNTMTEIINLDKLDKVSLTILAERLDKRLPESEIMDILIKQLKQHGWNNDEIRIEGGKDSNLLWKNSGIAPSVVLMNYEKTVAIIQIRMTNQLISNNSKVHVQSVLNKCRELPIIIITNLKKYDFYIIKNNKHIVFDVIPSKDEVLALLDDYEVSGQ